MVNRCKGLEHRWACREGGQRLDLVNENVASVAGIDRCLGGSGVTCDDDASVGRVEAIAVALHGVPGRECCYGYVRILVDHASSYFVRVDPRPLGKVALISVWIRTGFDVLVVGEKNVLGHRLDPFRAVDFERDFSSD